MRAVLVAPGRIVHDIERKLERVVIGILCWIQGVAWVVKDAVCTPSEPRGFILGLLTGGGAVAVVTYVIDTYGTTATIFGLLASISFVLLPIREWRRNRRKN